MLLPAYQIEEDATDWACSTQGRDKRKLFFKKREGKRLSASLAANVRETSL
jgi:hypothetical protein